MQASHAAGFTHWSVRDNKWTTVPERTAAALPENHRRPALKTTGRAGTEGIEQHAGIRHTPAEREVTFPLAVARWKKAGARFWRYGLVAHDERRRAAQAVMSRPRLKGGKEQLFKEVLRGLALHHPPCESLVANQMFYAIAALAYNLMKAVQLLCLPDECQRWTGGAAAQTKGAAARAAGAPRAAVGGAGVRAGTGSKRGRHSPGAPTRCSP